MNKEMYTDTHRHLKDAVRRKHLKKWKAYIWFLLHDNAPAHQLVLVKDFLAKNNVTTLDHPPYSPDLAPTDFYLFPLLKSALKGGRCCDATDIIENVTEELKRLSKMASRNVSKPCTVAGTNI
jgi:histone-lysine N-methyltransferase SETMAR